MRSERDARENAPTGKQVRAVSGTREKMCRQESIQQATVPNVTFGGLQMYTTGDTPTLVRTKVMPP